MTPPDTSPKPPPGSSPTLRRADGEIDWPQVHARIASIGRLLESEAAMSPESEAALLAERARHLAEPPEEERGEDMLALLRVRLGREDYAVHAGDVVAVATGVEIAALPGATGPLVALAAWRSRVLRTIDVRPALGVSAPASRTVLVIGEYEADLALLVDSVEDAEVVRHSELQPAPADVAASDLLRGILQDGTPLLDLRAAVRLAGLRGRDA
jgi:chemotaxis signal transduction protein